jgi:hypothetical protein
VTQTIALLVDAYRELNAKKLFWITLILSLLFAGAIGALGINASGITIFRWELDLPLNTNVMSEEDFYKFVFVNLGLGVWLTWIATVLALVSTAQMIPDFISGGAVELALSKPISRARLFLTKYATGLLFVALQVVVFALASFLVIGLRGDAWEPGLFLSVPVVLAFFSFLFCVCALLGLITKSTIASLLLTLLFWFLVFVVNTADGRLLQQLARFDLQIERRETVIANLQESRESAAEQLAEARPIADADDARPSDRQRVERLEQRIAGIDRGIKNLERDIPNIRDDRAAWAPWFDGVFAVKTVLPKTGETIALLDRWLVEAANLNEAMAGSDQPDDDELDALINQPDASQPAVLRVGPQDVNAEVERRIESRSVAWVLGTSFAFEFVILLIATVIFSRRDF